MSEKLTAFYETHDEIDAVIILKHVFHVHYEWMINLKEYVFFKFDVFKLFIFYNNVLPYTFHRVYLLCVLILDEINLPKGALAYHFHNCEVL